MASASGGMDIDMEDRGSRFRGLENLTTFPDLEPNYKKKRLNQNNNNVIDPKTGFVSQEKTYGEFYVIEKLDKTSFETTSPFFVEKALTTQIGSDHETKRLRNGTLLVKCKNDKQAQLLQKFNNVLFGSTFKVKVTEHTTLNTIQGTIRCEDSKNWSEAEIQEGLAAQKVVAVQKMQRKVGDALVYTGTCVLTFKKSILPSSIKFGYINCNVKPFIPNPMRCLNCFRFGHTRKHCTKDRICISCSESFHEAVCSSEIRCVNCNGKHKNISKDCPRFKRELGIQTIKVQNKISYFEAKKKYDSIPHLDCPINFNTLSYSKQLSLNKEIHPQNKITEKKQMSPTKDSPPIRLHKVLANHPLPTNSTPHYVESTQQSQPAHAQTPSNDIPSLISLQLPDSHTIHSHTPTQNNSEFESTNNTTSVNQPNLPHFPLNDNSSSHKHISLSLRPRKQSHTNTVDSRDTHTNKDL